MNIWLRVLLVVIILLGGLYSFWRSSNLGLYTGFIDDSFLRYFEPGEEYTVIEMIKRVNEKTKGKIRLGQFSFAYWLNGSVKAGKLKKRMVTRTTKKGSFQVEAYRL